MNHSKATAAKKSQTPTPWHKVRTSPYVCSGLWFTSRYSTKNTQTKLHALTGKRKWSLFPHQMGSALIKRTLKIGLIFSNHHLPILKTGILIHPPVTKKQETKVCKREWWKVTEKTQICLFFWDVTQRLLPPTKWQNKNSVKFSYSLWISSNW